MDEPTRAGGDEDVSVEALVRLGAGAAWHTTSWAARTSLRLGKRALRATTSPDEAADLARDMVTASRVFAEGVADVLDGVGAVVGEENGVSRVVRAGSLGAHGVADTLAQVLPERANGAVVNGTVVVREESLPDPAEVLRRQGQALLERSRDVWIDDVGHPAYEQILTQLAPDEARILLLLLRGGPQPSVDVRTGGPIGMVSSQLIAPGLTMIGSRSGCRHLDRVPAYLNNLHRLGLVWFSHEPLADPRPYQVLEAQPDVLAAMHTVRFPKVVRRSIHLTPFGEDFCRAALITPEEGTGLPAHQVPEQGANARRTEPSAPDRTDATDPG